MDGFELALRSGLASVSLYIHVPFCGAKCSYCDFRSFSDVAPDRLRQVLRETRCQLEYFGRRLRPLAVPSVYVGGGTPSLLRPDQISELLEAARAFGRIPAEALTVAARSPRAAGPFAVSGLSSPPDPSEEWTVEANPESLSAEWLAACREAGVSRISLGVQSLQDPLLVALGRRATANQTRRALALLDREWPRTRSVDLLAGIPGQSRGDLERDIREVCDGSCGHVSLYTLTPPSGSSLRVDRDAADRLWMGGRRLLEQLGYANYEISNFARPGEECRHNLRYWRMEPYLGVGPAAVGTLPAIDGAPCRLSNPGELTPYLEGEASGWGLELERIAARDFLLENLMMGLRLRQGIDRRLFVARFGTGFPELLPDLWRDWRRRRMVRADAGFYALTEKGRLRLNPLLVEASTALELVDPRLPLSWP